MRSAGAGGGSLCLQLSRFLKGSAGASLTRFVGVAAEGRGNEQMRSGRNNLPGKAVLFTAAPRPTPRQGRGSQEPLQRPLRPEVA